MSTSSTSQTAPVNAGDSPHIHLAASGSDHDTPTVKQARSQRRRAHGKRARVDSSEDSDGAGGVPAEVDVSQNMAKVDPTTSTNSDCPAADYTRSPDFWYPDGNVVIKVEDVGYRLHASRLARHCSYFAELFGENTPSGGLLLDGGTAVKIPVTARQFDTLLKVLDMPLEYPVHTASLHRSIVLCNAAKALGCSRAQEHALARIQILCSSSGPPKPQPTRNGPTTCTYEDAADLITIARQRALPRSVLKYALYEVLRSAAFWEAVDTRGNGAVLAKITQADLLGLYAARTSLGKSWRALCLEPPAVHMPLACRCAAKDMQARAKAWRELLAHALVDDLDPIAYADQLKMRFVPSGGEWCGTCVRKQSWKWATARSRWWRQLDVWFRLAPEGSVAQ